MAPDRGYRIVDLMHLGRPESVAACLLESAEGELVIDPGPSSTLPQLRAALGKEPAAVLLTHIHLDHAGGTGTLARENPRLRVYVHAKGAPHLIDPTKLVSSAERLYGDRMEELWAEIVPVSPDQVVVLQGGETLRIGSREIEVAYTPGHAWHHVSYFEAEHQVAFVGDTAGIFGPRLPVVLPVTPPPDFDLDSWLGSIERILDWHPRELVLTHFGPSSDPVHHFSELREGLLAWTSLVKETLAVPGSDSDRITLFVEQLRAWIAPRVPADRAEAYLAAAGPEACWQGIARWVRKQ